MYLGAIRRIAPKYIAKLQKAIISFVGSQWMDLHEILHLSIFRKSVEKIQVSLKSDNNT
jgi:hypothetical protein